MNPPIDGGPSDAHDELDDRLRRELASLVAGVTPSRSGGDVADDLVGGRIVARSSRAWPVVASAAALVVVLLAVGIARRGPEAPYVGSVGTTSPSGQRTTTPPGSAPPTTLDLGSPGAPAWAQQLGSGWHDLPAPPFTTIDPRAPGLNQRLVVVDGDTIVAVQAYAVRDRLDIGVAALDLVSGQWARLADPPGTSSGGFGMVGTGQGVVFWNRTGVLRYDPREARDRWTRFGPAPRALANSAGWPGRGGPVSMRGTVFFWADGLAYDTALDQWREVAKPPLVPARVSAAWASERLVVFGLDEQSWGGGTVAPNVGYSYDPRTDAWTEFADPGLTALATDLVGISGGMIGVDYGSHARQFAIATGTWSDLAPLPVGFGETEPRLYPVGPYVVLSFPRGLAVLDPAGRWTTVPSSGGWLGSGSGVLVSWGTKLEVWVPPPADSAGRFPAPSTIMVGPWRLPVPDAMAAVEVRGEHGVFAPEAEIGAPSGTCTVRYGAFRPDPRGDGGPAWWFANDSAKQPLTAPAGSLLGSGIRGELDSGRYDDRAHVALTWQYDNPVEITCRSLADARALADALQYVPYS